MTFWLKVREGTVLFVNCPLATSASAYVTCSHSSYAEGSTVALKLPAKYNALSINNKK